VVSIVSSIVGWLCAAGLITKGSVEVCTYVGPHFGGSSAVVAHNARFCAGSACGGLRGGHGVLLYFGRDRSLPDVAGDVCVGGISLFVVVVNRWDGYSWGRWRFCIEIVEESEVSLDLKLLSLWIVFDLSPPSFVEGN
jgi:hypothetical protein